MAHPEDLQGIFHSLRTLILTTPTTLDGVGKDIQAFADGFKNTRRGKDPFENGMSHMLSERILREQRQRPKP